MNSRKIFEGLYMPLDGVVEFRQRCRFRYINRDMSEAIVAGKAQADAVLLGPETCRIFAGIWPKVNGNGAISVTDRAARLGEQAPAQSLDFPSAASH